MKPSASRAKPGATRDARPAGASSPGKPVTGSAKPATGSAEARRRRESTRIPKGRGSSRPGGATAPSRVQALRNRIEPVAPGRSWMTTSTVRMVVLVVVIALATVVVLPSLRAYFRQQEELAELRAEAEQARAEVEELEAEKARWEDPAFIVAQARERLAYVFPGETPYRVIDPEVVEGAAEGSPAAAEQPDVRRDGTWYTRLWDTFEEAGGVPEDAEAEGADAEAGADSGADSGTDAASPAASPDASPDAGGPAASPAP